VHKPPLPAGQAAAFAAAAAAAAAVFGVTACSASQAATVTGAAGTTTTTAARTTARMAASPSATIPNCHVGVWADKYTDAGHLAWQVSLPVNASLADGNPAAPLAIGGVSVFPDGDAVYALRTGNGHQVWHRVFGTPENPNLSAVDDLLAWHGSVIALLGADGSTPELASLDASTGAVRWTARLGSLPLEFDNSLSVTSDGVAAINTGTQGTVVTAIDLTTGKQLWSRRYAKTPFVQTAGTTVVVSSKTSGESPVTLTGLRARSGAPLWSRTGFPNWVRILSAPGGRVLVDGADEPPPMPPKKPAVYPVIALSAATGKTLWQVKTPQPVTAIWPTAAGVAIATGLAGRVYVEDPTARLYLASLTTGKVRWSVPGHTDPEATPVITPAGVITVATTPATGTVTGHSARTGAVTWKAPITDVYGRFLAKPAGPNVLVAFPGASASKPSRLLALDAATGATRATDLLPYTATVNAPITVAGGSALLEPETASCAVGVVPGPASTAGPAVSTLP
jgi:outer membrane protein assembly factor BamB